jgi:integrase
MHNMENTPLVIPPNKRVKGLVVYCNKCRTNITTGICKTTGKPVKQCPHGDKHVFKIYLHVKGTQNERRTKNLKTRDVNEAIKQAIDFEREARGNNYPKEISNKVGRTREKVLRQGMPDNILKAMARYVGFLHNDPEIVPGFISKERSLKHVEDVERNFKYFVMSLRKNGCNPDSFSLREIDEQVIGKFHEYMANELKLSNSSFNRAITELKSLYNYLINQGCQVKNPFKPIPRMPVKPNIETITQEEYNRLLDIIQKPELGRQVLSNGVVKHLYKLWMKDAIELGLLTGRRTEEIVQMKWSNVFEDEKGNPLYIQAIDYKVSRQKGQEKVNPKQIYIPVTSELKDLLSRLNYEKYKQREEFILAPEEKMKRETINKFITHSFPHYYQQLGTGRNLSYKCLRKTYISKLSAFMGIDNARLITRHSGTEVMENHYVDMKIIAREAQDFKMFEQGDIRENEIKKIRSVNQEKNIER